MLYTYCRVIILFTAGPLLSFHANGQDFLEVHIVGHLGQPKTHELIAFGYGQLSKTLYHAYIWVGGERVEGGLKDILLTDMQILWEVDTILFSLLILRGLCDSQGRVWRCHPDQLYAVEVTLPHRDNRKFFPESWTLSLLDLLPSVLCVSPGRTKDLNPKDTGT